MNGVFVASALGVVQRARTRPADEVVSPVELEEIVNIKAEKATSEYNLLNREAFLT